MNRNEEFVKELKKYVPSDSNVDIYLKDNVIYIASKEEVDFIKNEYEDEKGAFNL